MNKKPVDRNRVELVKDLTRAVRGGPSVERIVQDLRIARRGLARSPGYVVVVVVTLALGIGATTALFTVVNAVLLRPLQFPQPERLVMVWERPPVAIGNGVPGRSTNIVQTQNYLDWLLASSSSTRGSREKCSPARIRWASTLRCGGTSPSRILRLSAWLRIRAPAI